MQNSLESRPARQAVAKKRIPNPEPAQLPDDPAINGTDLPALHDFLAR
jgi:hypothetical protein